MVHTRATTVDHVALYQNLNSGRRRMKGLTFVRLHGEHPRRGRALPGAPQGRGGLVDAIPEVGRITRACPHRFGLKRGERKSRKTLSM